MIFEPSRGSSESNGALQTDFTEIDFYGRPVDWVGTEALRIVAVAGLDQRIEVEQDDALLLTTDQFSVPVPFAERVLDASRVLRDQKANRGDYNCASYAHHVAGVDLDEHLSKGISSNWDFKRRSLVRLGQFSTGRVAKQDPQGLPNGTGHWHTVLAPGRKGVSLHVDGFWGPLLLSRLPDVRKLYRRSRSYQASPKTS